VTGGNVSFYNQTGHEPINPTPVVGVLGILPDVRRRLSLRFRRAGARLVLLGRTGEDFGGSAWACAVHGHLGGRPPAVDLAAERSLAAVLASAAEDGLLAAAHDLSEGGLAVALVEATLASGVGATITLPPVLPPAGGDGAAAGGPAALPPEQVPLAALASESASRVLLAAPPEAAGDLKALAADAAVPATRLGTAGGDRLVVSGLLDLPLSRLRDAYEGALPHALGELL
jgi:phosphoribosylformylglycinamidine synthase subunit PurL